MYVDQIVLNTDIYLAMIRLIHTAQKTLILSSFVCDGLGSPGVEIAQAVNAAGTRGVDVRIVYSMSAVVRRRHQEVLSKSFLALLEGGPTVRVREFVHYLFNAMHMKLLVVDGMHCLISGANIQALVTDCGWSDTGLEFHGTSSALSLAGHFETIWTQSTAVPLVFSPKKQETTTSRLQTLTTPGNTIPIATEVPHRIVFQEACALCLRNTRQTDLTTSLYTLLRSAQARIDIITPNFADTRVFELLVALVQTRGIRVRVLTALQMHEGMYTLLAMTTNEDAFRRFKDQFQFRFSNRQWCDRNGRNCRTCQTPNPADDTNVYGVNHSKFISVDNGQHVLLGSANLEPISLTYSVECNVELHPTTPGTQAKFQGVFDQFWDAAEPGM